MTGIENKEAIEEVSEQTFNINIMLTRLYDNVRKKAQKRGVDLVFDMDTTLPRRLRGDVDGLISFFTKILNFVLEQTPNREVVLSIHAPEDFLYRELTSFRIENSGIARDKLRAYVQENLISDLEMLDGKLEPAEGTNADLIVGVELKNWYLGFRRHYRLPKRELTRKKVALVCECRHRSRSMRNMFEYFLYDVTTLHGSEEISDEVMEKNDILCVCEHFLSTQLLEKIDAVQKRKDLKLVVMRDSDTFDEAKSARIDANFIKPVTQEKVLHLIIALYDESFPKKASHCIL